MSDLTLDTEPAASAGARVQLIASAAPAEIAGLQLHDLRVGGALRTRGGVPGLDAFVRGRATLAGAEVELTGAAGEHAVLKGRLEPLSLGALVRQMIPGAALPPEVPDFTVALAVDVHPRAGEFRLEGSATLDAWPALGLTAGQLRATVELRRTVEARADGAPAPRVRCDLSLAGEGPFRLVEGVACDRFAFSFHLVQGEEWSVEGRVDATVFGTALGLEARYEDTQLGRRLRLAATGDALLAVGAAELSFGGLFLEMERTRDGDAWQTAWRVGGSGGLSLPNPANPADVWRLSGELAVHGGGDDAGLTLRFRDGEIPLTLPVSPDGGQALRFTVQPRRLAVLRDAEGWAFEAVSAFSLTGLPRPLQRALPDRTTCTLRIDGSGATLTADQVLAPLPIPIPPLPQADGSEVPLGDLLLQATDLRLRLGTELSLGATLGVGVPVELNRVFGVTRGADGSLTHTTTVFAGYDAAAPRPDLAVRVAVGVRDGAPFVEAAPAALPLRGLRPDPDGYFRLELGACGSAYFKMPVFRYDAATSSFEAEGEFGHRDLAVPLVLLKRLLAHAGMQNAADRVPDALPLREVSLLDARDELDAPAAIRLFEETLHTDLAQPVEDAFTAVARHFNRLPARLRQYLRIRVPERLAFRVAVSPDGGVALHLSTSLQKERYAADGTRTQVPLTLLLPDLGPAGPALTGIRLYGLTLGTVFGGAALRVEADVEVDQFDVLPLAAALAAQEAGVPVFAPAERIGRRVVVRDLTTLVVIATQVPIPIPLFYEEIAFESLGLEGTGLSTHFRLPMPRPNLREVLATLGELRKFLADPDYFLDPAAAPVDTDLRWTIGENYLQLPSWLGGEVLGVRGGDVAVVSASQTVARVLNAVKGMELLDLLETVPLEHRVGRAGFSLGPIRTDTAWLLTTLREYPSAAAAAPGWAERAPVLSRVVALAQAEGRGVPVDERGAVALLAGRWGVGAGAELDVAAGVVLGRRRGVAAAYRVAGRVEGALDLELAGEALALADQGRVEIGGAARLALFGHTVMEGTVQGSNDGFGVSGRMDLLGWAPGSPLALTAFLEGRVSRDTFAFDGAATATFGSQLTLAGGTFHVSPGRMEVAGTWLGQTLRLEITANPGRLVFRGGFDAPVGLPGIFTLSSERDPAGGPLVVLAGPDDPELRLDARVEVLGMRAGAEVVFSADGFRAELAGSLFGLVSCQATLAGPDLLDPARTTATVHLQNGFRALQDAIHQAVQAEVRHARDQVEAARDRVRSARLEADQRLAREVQRLQEEAARQRGRAGAEMEQAQDRLREAREKLAVLDHELANARAAVANDRRHVEEGFQKALRDLDHAREKLQVIQREIDSHNAWYYGMDGAGRFWHAIPFAAKASALEIARVAALGPVEIAAGVVELARRAKDGWHPDADPRVVAILAARDTAHAALTVAQAAVGTAQAVNDTLPDWVRDPRILAVEAARGVSNLTLAAAEQTLRTTEEGVGAVLAIGDALNAGIGLPVEVLEAGFTTALAAASAPLPVLHGRARVSVWDPAGPRRERWIDLHVDFADLPGTGVRLAKELFALP